MDRSEAVRAALAAQNFRAAAGRLKSWSGHGLSLEMSTLAAELLGSSPDKLPLLSRLLRETARAGLADDPAQHHRALAICWLGTGYPKKALEAFNLAASAAKDRAESLHLRTGAVSALTAMGRVDEAAALAKELAAGLLAEGRPDLAARPLVNAGSALLAGDKWREAAALFRQAIGLAGEDNGFLVAAAKAGLASALALGEEAAQGALLAAESAAWFQEQGMAAYALEARLTAALAHSHLGRPDLALAALEHTPDGLSLAAMAKLTTARAEVLMGLNLWAEAAQGLPLPSAQRALPPQAKAYIRLLKAECASLLGESGAERLLSQAAAYAESAGQPAIQALALCRAAETAAPKRRREQTAARAMEAAARAESTLLAARAWLVLAGEQESLPDPPPSIARGLRHPSLAWKWERLRASRAKGAKRLKRLRAMKDRILDARLLVASPSARLSLLKDKEAALQEFAQALLESSAPDRIKEISDLAAETRSAALVDEILSGGAAQLSEQDRALLAGLRSSLGHPGRGFGSRSSGAKASLGGAELASLRARLARQSGGAVQSSAGTGAPILLEADGAWHIVSGREVRRAAESAQLDRLMRRLEFELSEPLLRPTASPQAALAVLAELHSAIGAPFEEAAQGSSVVCAAGRTWSVPWAAVLGRELACALHPSMTVPPRLERAERVVIWIHGDEGLANAEDEARLLLQMHPDALVCRTVAEAAESLKGGADLLHAVGHGDHSPESPMLSALQFPDGRLTALEISASPFRPKLVYLSACSTGRMSSPSPFEPDGIARAFLARGAMAVVGSLWPLDDAAALEASHAFYRAGSDGAGPLESLAAARAAVREKMPHPFYWGALTLFAGWQSDLAEAQ